jgi:hypothetical protein
MLPLLLCWGEVFNTGISEGRGIREKNFWRRFLAEAQRRRGEGDLCEQQGLVKEKAKVAEQREQQGLA